MQRQLPKFLVRATFTSVAILSMSACGSDAINLPVVGADKAASDRFLDDVAAVAYASSVSDKDHSDDNAYVVFIKKSGETSVLKTGAYENGVIATNRQGQVSWVGGSNRYVLGGSDGLRRDGRIGNGMAHWMGTRKDGSFVTVVNNGNGDIYWTDGGRRRHSEMGSPDAMGIADDVLYSTDMDFGMDGRATLWATDLSGDRKIRKSVTWTCPTDSLGDQLSSPASGIFQVGGKLFFLESEIPPDEKLDFPDGSSEKISLAEVDVAKGTHTSTEVASFPYWMDQVDENDDSALAWAAHEGHLHGGRIHTMSHSGRMLAFDTATKKVATIGTVSKAAQNASSAAITFDGNTMTVLFYSAEFQKPAVLETYDLDTGDRTNRIEVEGLVDLIREDDTGLFVSGVATLHE